MASPDQEILKNYNSLDRKFAYVFNQLSHNFIKLDEGEEVPIILK